MLTATLLLVAQLSTAPARGELLAEHRSVRPGGRIVVALRVELEPKWHIYWHNSGDSGMPTDVRWSAPEGVTVRPLPWPAPRLVKDGHLVMYGYEDEVLFPVEVSVPKEFEAENLKIGVKADWLVCADVCEEGGAAETLEIEVDAKEPVADPLTKEAFARMRAAQPQAAPDGAVQAVSARELRLDPAKLKIGDSTAVHFFARESGVLAYAKKQTLKRGNDSVSLELPLPDGHPMGKTERLRGVLVLTEGATRRAFAVDLPIEPTKNPKGEKPQ